MVKRPIAVKAAREFNQETDRAKAIVRDRPCGKPEIHITTNSPVGVMPFQAKKIIREHNTNIQVKEGKLVLF